MPEFSDLFRLLSGVTRAGANRAGVNPATTETADGDTGCWHEFIEAFGGTVRAIVCRKLRDCGCRARPEDVHEIEQEVYCRLLGRGGRGRTLVAEGDAAARAYVGRVAMAVIIDRMRRESAGKRRCERLRSALSSNFDHVRGHDIDPEERMLVLERVEWVADRCRRIAGTRDRDTKLRALLLVVLGGYRSLEVVAALDGRISASHVDTLISRLRGRMAEDGFVLPRRNAAALGGQRPRYKRAA